jgi:hypothetical protein
VAAQLLRDRLDLAGRHALHVHLGQRGHERLLRALVALEQLGREAAVAVLRYPQLQLADPGDEGATVVTAAMAEPRRRPFAFRRPAPRSSRPRKAHAGPPRRSAAGSPDPLPEAPSVPPARPKLASGHGVHPQVTFDITRIP